MKRTRLNIRAYGTHASLEWDQEHPNELIVKYPDASRRTLRRGNDYVSDIAKRPTRLARGQPEGFIEAFANIYIEAARAINAELYLVPGMTIGNPGIEGGQIDFCLTHSTARTIGHRGCNILALAITDLKDSIACADTKLSKEDIHYLEHGEVERT